MTKPLKPCTECGVVGGHHNGCPETPDGDEQVRKPDDEPAERDEPEIPEGPWELPDRHN